jgi:short-subunit dehydrogenase
MHAIITGASRGMGKSIAIAFAEQGYNLVLVARDPVKLEETRSELESRFSSLKVVAKAFDLQQKDQCDAMGEWVLQSGVSVDVLVNNAGQFVPGSVYNEPEGSLEQMLSINLMSAYHVTRKLVDKMISQKSGHIFNICSIAALKAYANGGSYSISKFALAGFSRNLREEMKPFGIKVTTVYPGAAYTDSWIGSGVERSRIMEAEDISKMVVASSGLSASACVEEIVVRPLLGDL